MIVKCFHSLLAISLFIVLSSALSAQEIDEITRDLEVERIWPKGHPAGALMDRFYDGEAEFDFYIWRENGFVWAEIVVRKGIPYICSSSFNIIQGGIEWETTFLASYAGDRKCGDVHVKREAYNFTQGRWYEAIADLRKSFRIFHDGGWRHPLNILAVGPGFVREEGQTDIGEATLASFDSGGSGGGGGGCLINTVAVGN